MLFIAAFVAWFAHIVIALPLWFPHLRTFPMLPATDFEFTFSTPARLVCYAIFTAAAMFALLKKTFFRLGIVLSLLVYGVFVLEDINRLQPYFYFYGFVFLILGVYLAEKQHSDKIMALRLLLGACYFWSGIFKINAQFPSAMQLVFRRMDFNFIDALPPQTYFLIAFAEIFLGLLFLDLSIKRQIKWHFLLAISLHLAIILTLVLAKWNKTVIIWNFFMIFLLLWLLVFQEKNAQNLNFIQIVKRQFLFIFLVLLLPALNFFGYWDNYLSWRVYSGNSKKFNFYFEKNPIPEEIYTKYQLVFWDKEAKRQYISVQNWLLYETNTAFYAEERYFEKLKAKYRHE